MDVDSAFAFRSHRQEGLKKLANQNKQQENGVELVFKSPVLSPILSQNIWRSIVRKLPTGDFLSAINTCPEWNEMTTREKPTELLPMVLPKLMEYLPKETILACRKISNESKKVVNHVLREHQTSPCQLFKDELQQSSRHQYFLSQIEEINNSYDFRRKPPHEIHIIRLSTFLYKCVRSRQILDAPILTGSISFTIGQAITPSGNIVTNPAHFLAYNQRRLEANRNLYPPVGEYWYLQTALQNIQDFPESFYLGRLDLEIHYTNDIRSATNLIVLLREVRFLKSLKVYVGPDQRSKSDLESITVEMLPRLESLRFLELQGADVPIFSAIILRKYGKSLTHLVCNGSVFEQSNLVGVDFLNEFLPELRNLRIRNPGIGLQTIVKLSGVGWKLERLHLNLIGIPVRVPDLLRCVANFAQHLKELSILGYPQSGNYANSIEETFRIILKPDELHEFQKLKKLVLEDDYIRSVWIQEFLTYKCRQLQELHLVSPQTHHLTEVSKACRAFDNGILERIGFWERNYVGNVIKRVDLITRERYVMPSKPINVDRKIYILNS